MRSSPPYSQEWMNLHRIWLHLPLRRGYFVIKMCQYRPAFHTHELLQWLPCGYNSCPRRLWALFCICRYQWSENRLKHFRIESNFFYFRNFEYLQQLDINNMYSRFFQVQETEGATLAASHAIGFCEVSVADNSPSLYKAFERLLAESRARPVKPRKFSVSKMFGKIRLNWLTVVSGD